METADDILEQLRNSHHRITKIRKAMVELFCHIHKPVSADWVKAKLEKRKDIEAHKVTVYRELDFLIEAEVLQKVDFGDRKKRYELGLRAHHHHVVCTSCHHIEDVVLSGHLKKEIINIQKQKHFKVTSHALEFFGLCKTCLTT